MQFRPIESHQSCKKIHKIHNFGTSLSPNNKRQFFFSQSISKNASSSFSDLLKENQVLKHEVCAIRETLTRILIVEGYEESEASMEKTAQLLEEVIMLILRRSEEINRLKKELSSHIIDAQRESYFSSGSQTLRKSSNTSIYSGSSSPHNQIKEESSYIREIPIHRVLNISKYQPKALLSIGKQVKTINRLSSNHLLKKDSHNSSICSSVQSSLRQLLHLKNKNRLSIDKSIYIPDDGEFTQRTERYHISKQKTDDNQILCHHQFTISNISYGMELTPIKEERFSKYSQMESSKINFYKGERFTFESTTSDPQSYANKTE